MAQSVLKIGFALAKKVGWGGRVSAQDAMHMAAALAGCRKALVGTGCRKALVGTGFGISAQTGIDKASSAFLGAPFLALLAVFSQEKRSLVGGP